MMVQEVAYSSTECTFVLNTMTNLMVLQPINPHSAKHDAATSNIKKEFRLVILRCIDADVPSEKTGAKGKSNVLEETY